MTKNLQPSMSPPSLTEVFSAFVKLDNSTFDALTQQIHSRQAFNADKSRCIRLAEQFDLSVDTVGLLLVILGNLYSRLRDMSADNESVPEMVENFLNEVIEDDEDDALDATDRDRLKTRLTELLVLNPYVERAKKLNRLSSGFLNNAVGFSTFLDLRPNFTTDEDGNLDGVDSFIPVIQLRISTDADDESEKSIIVQLSADALDKLHSIVERTQKKMTVIKELPDLQNPIEWDDE